MKLNDWARTDAAAGGCGNVTRAVGSDSENTGRAANTRPREFKEDEAVDEDSGGDAGRAETTVGVRSK